MRPPRDITGLDGLIDGTIFPQIKTVMRDFLDENGRYFGIADLSLYPDFDYLPVNSYFISSYNKRDGTIGFKMYSRITSATPTVVSEPYVPNWDDDLEPEEQIVEYQDVTYFDWERIDDFNGSDQYWEMGDFEGEPL
jgi:hypothetical protein